MYYDKMIAIYGYATYLYGIWVRHAYKIYFVLLIKRCAAVIRCCNSKYHCPAYLCLYLIWPLFICYFNLKRLLWNKIKEAAGTANKLTLILGVVHKLRWQDFGFFWPPTPYVDIFYGMNVDKKWWFLGNLEGGRQNLRLG